MAETYLQRLQQRQPVPLPSIQVGTPGASPAYPGQSPARRPQEGRRLQYSQELNPPQQSQGAPQGTAAAGANQQTGSYTPQQFLDWQKSRYGRAGTEQENAPIAQRIGAGQGANGTYTQQQWDDAQRYSDEVATGYGWRPPQAPPPPPPPPGPPPPPQPGEVGHQGRVAVEPGPGYQAERLQAFQPPQTGNVAGLNQALMERILANPESLPPDVVNQMKAQGRDTAVSQADQLRSNAGAALAGRGFSGNGGMQTAANVAVDQNLLSELLNTNRATDIHAAGQNFQDRLNAAGAGDQFQNSAMQRALGAAGMENERFRINQGSQQAQSDDEFRRAGFRADQMNQDRSSNLNEFMGRSSVALDNRRADEQARQFNQMFGFDIVKFLEDSRRDTRNFGEGSRQFNVGAGLTTAGLQQQSNDTMLRWLQMAMSNR